MLQNVGDSGCCAEMVKQRGTTELRDVYLASFEDERYKWKRDF